MRFRPPATAFGSRAAWYVVAASDEIAGPPEKRTALGIPVVVFRTRDGAARVFVDRCPHRGVPLSFGTVVADTIQCGYHGWRFDRDGCVTEIPGLAGDPRHPARCVPVFPVCEQQGFVWAWLDPTCEPTGEPVRFRLLDDPEYTTVHTTLDTPASRAPFQEVEYRMGGNHVVANAACTPVTPDRTRLHGVVSLRSVVPSVVLRPLVAAVAQQVFR